VKYNACVFLFSLFWALSAQAQDDVFRHPLGPQTMDTFTEVCSRFAAQPYMRGSFTQEKIFIRPGRSLKSSGNFIIAAELGMVWDTVKPFPSTLTLGKDYIIQSRPRGKKTVVNAQGNETFLRIAEAIGAVFSGNVRGLLDNFNVYFTGSAVGWVMGLTPKDTVVNSLAESIIMKGDGVIRSIHLIEQNGDFVQYHFSNHSFPAEPDAYERAFFSLP